MAVQFNTSAKRMTQGTAALPTAAGTIAIRFRCRFTPGDSAWHSLFGQKSGTPALNLGQFTDNVFYAGWKSQEISVAAASMGLALDGDFVLVFTWNDSANTEYLYNDPQYSNTSTLRGQRTSALTTGSLAGGTRKWGSWADVDTDADSDIQEVAVWDYELTEAERKKLTSLRFDFASASAPTDHLILETARISGATVTALAGTNGTLVGSPSIVDGPVSAGPVPYTIADYQNAIAAALAGATLPDGVSATPAYDMFSSEGITDLPAEMVQGGSYATKGSWTQSAADARFSTRAVDGVYSGATLLAAVEYEYDNQFGGSIPAYMTSPSQNHPENYARDAYGAIMGASFAYTQGRVFGDNSLSGKIGNWNTGNWPGASTSGAVYAGPGGRVSWPGKYGSAITDLWEVLVLSMYSAPVLELEADGSFSNHPQAKTRANYILEFPEAEGADDEETALLLMGPVTAAHCASMLDAYPGKEYWPSIHNSLYAYDGTEPALAAREARITAAALQQIEDAGATGVWCFSDGTEYASNSYIRSYWLDVVQRFNLTGDYAPNTARPRNRNRRSMIR